jgi:NAD(P) transhydrogenase subunit beta
MIQVAYLIAAVLFILGLRGLTAPDTARRGMNLAALGMLAAVIGTLLHHDIVRYEWILVGIVVGSAVGAAMAIFMPMTAMPQRIALSHAFGALAATLVGLAKYDILMADGDLGRARMGAIAFEVMFGSLTITGSLMAFAKLQELMRGAPITYRGQNAMNITLFALTFCLFIYLVFDPSQRELLYVMAGLGLTIVVLMVLPIGGADMPVVISLLNSYAGLAASATGFAIDNNVLIIAGALDGASGFLLSILMSRARTALRERSGAFGTPQERPGLRAPPAPRCARSPSRTPPSRWPTRGS